ncbi:hypothetical protein BCEP4_410083 [Burkholderia cepacia]|nr:hypothetical protein BCEP4_410083 [Burkholderia cepacia]
MRIDNGGITLEGVAIRVKGPMTQQTSGSKNAISIAGMARQGRAINPLCAMRDDGSCPLGRCPCGRSGGVA